MKLTFIGADHEVTGSCHHLFALGKNLLIDYGMQQGRDLYENADLDVDPAMIDYVLLTHAHLDHTGMLPLLYKNGFRGEVYCTEATADLCSIMLADSAHIHEAEAEWKNRKRQRRGEPPIEPIYTMQDVQGLMELFHDCPYNRTMTLTDGITMRFTDVGHLLGSSAIELRVQEDGVEKSIIFSGDIGNVDQPLLRDPQPVDGADYLVIESTYGNRLHEKPADYIEPLVDILRDTFKAGGNLVIPSFAVGRTQEMLYYFREIKHSNRLPEFPDFPVYVDSPLAIESTKVFTHNERSCFDEEAIGLLRQGINPIGFSGLHTSVTGEESKAINFDPTPKVIISASGMCDAGRIRHHLKYNLWRPESTVLFVGYQGEGTLGRRLLEGADTVTLLGEEIAVRATIKQLPGVSGHADQKGLLNWVDAMKQKPSEIFVVHGEDQVTDFFADLLTKSFDVKASAPYSGSVYDLTRGCYESLATPKPITRKAPTPPKEVNAPYQRLLTALSRLKTVVEKSSKRPVKELARMTDQILSIVEKWS